MKHQLFLLVAVMIIWRFITDGCLSGWMPMDIPYNLLTSKIGKTGIPTVPILHKFDPCKIFNNYHNYNYNYLIENKRSLIKQKKFLRFSTRHSF